MDIQTTSDSTGDGCNVSWIAGGKWLAYDVTVGTSGNYAVTLGAAAPYSSESVHLEVDDVRVT